jgi:hypothetical protein
MTRIGGVVAITRTVDNNPGAQQMPNMRTAAGAAAVSRLHDALDTVLNGHALAECMNKGLRPPLVACAISNTGSTMVVHATAIGEEVEILTGCLMTPEKVVPPITVMAVGQGGGSELFQVTGQEVAWGRPMELGAHAGDSGEAPREEEPIEVPAEQARLQEHDRNGAGYLLQWAHD